MSDQLKTVLLAVAVLSQALGLLGFVLATVTGWIMGQEFELAQTSVNLLVAGLAGEAAILRME
jgi:hypothetical protein